MPFGCRLAFAFDDRRCLGWLFFGNGDLSLTRTAAAVGVGAIRLFFKLLKKVVKSEFGRQGMYVFGGL